MATIQINHEWGNGSSTTIVVDHKVSTVEALAAMRIEGERPFANIIATVDTSNTTYVEASE